MQKSYQHYEDWFCLLKGRSDFETIVEVGTFKGDGTRFLKGAFSRAQIFTVQEASKSPAYPFNFEEVLSSLKDIATVIIDSSPMSYAWPIDYDLCIIELVVKAEENLAHIDYWLRAKKDKGILIVNLPRSIERKRKESDKVLAELRRKNISHQSAGVWTAIY